MGALLQKSTQRYFNYNKMHPLTAALH
jgi:hypothetical protein